MRLILKLNVLFLIFFLISINLLAQKSLDNNQFQIQKLDSLYKEHIKVGDTTNAIVNLADLGNLYSHRAQFAVSYNYFWKALRMSHRINDSLLIARVYNEIGWLYSYYDRMDQALDYYNQSLKIKKELCVKGSLSNRSIVSDYYSMVVLYRDMGNIELSKTYLDSCYSIYNNLSHPKNDSYLKSELAYSKIADGHYLEAIEILEDIQSWFTHTNPSYLIILNKFLADAFWGVGEFGKSELLYLKALEYAGKTKNHSNFVPIIHMQLANIYNEQKRFEEAYNQLKLAKEIETNLFDSRSMNNRPLLEIMDYYKKEQEYNQELIKEQELEQLKHERQVGIYRNLVLLACIILLLVFGIWRYRIIRLKHKLEKEQAQKKRESEMRQNKALIELKNKEFALNTLRIIEKDKQMVSLKEKLYEDGKDKKAAEIKKAFKLVEIDQNQNWKEFEARFVEINSSFYKVLTHTYPNLTAGELKLCALIKLNFSGKEIANLLGIGLESIHTLRYRLRKKFNLSREDNLTQFLNSLD